MSVLPRRDFQISEILFRILFSFLFCITDRVIDRNVKSLHLRQA